MFAGHTPRQDAVVTTLIFPKLRQFDGRRAGTFFQKKMADSFDKEPATKDRSKNK